MKVVLATTILLLAYVLVSRQRKKKLGTVPSPCVKLCRIEDGLCVGCKRTLDEIRDWMIMSEYEQNMLVHELKWRQLNG
jgi:predicted Fe-S protein YdhL (DUF1289 family)